MRTFRFTLPPAISGAVLLPTCLVAQTPAHDPSSTLQQVLPAAVAQQVLARIEEARSQDLPAVALEHRALELHAKGMKPADIPNAIAQAARAMAAGKAALAAGGETHPSDADIDAAGTAVAKGVDGATVSTLARSAPSGRSLAVPITALTALVDRGLPADSALARVVARLQARASDQQLAALPEQSDQGDTHKPALTGQALAATKRPSRAGRPTSTPAGTTPAGVMPPVAGPPSAMPPTSVPPTSVPTNGGPGNRPATPSTPSHPSGRP